jgi:hypothetical protein
MAMPGENNLPECPGCGRFFKRISDQTYCQECGDELGVPEAQDNTQEDLIRALAERTGIAPERIVQVVGTTTTTEGGFLGEEAPVEGVNPTCEVCQRRPGVGVSKLCIPCATERYKSLGKAAESVQERAIGVLDRRMRSATSLREAMSEKRARTASSRINTSGGQTLKKYI